MQMVHRGGKARAAAGLADAMQQASDDVNGAFHGKGDTIVRGDGPLAPGVIPPLHAILCTADRYFPQKRQKAAAAAVSVPVQR